MVVRQCHQKRLNVSEVWSVKKLLLLLLLLHPAEALFLKLSGTMVMAVQPCREVHVGDKLEES